MSIVSHFHPNSKALGAQSFPFLADERHWFIVSRPLDTFSLSTLRQLSGTDVKFDTLEEICSDAGLSGYQVTLVWVKDTKVLMLFSRYSTAEFLHKSGLSFSLDRGAGVLSKRISRIFRPFRFWKFFAPDDISIQFIDELDTVVFDGLGFVSSSFISKHFPALAEFRRFEITLMHADGQEKGHVMIDDSLTHDFMFPSFGRKADVCLAGRVFVGLDPVKGHDHMRLDIQSLVNLHPFFSNDFLIDNMQDEGNLFLDSIRTGEVDEILGYLGKFDTPSSLDTWRKWWLAEYLASGGKLMWFPSTVKAFANQHLKRVFTDRKKMRFPIPGMRYYIVSDVFEQTHSTRLLQAKSC